MGTRKIGPAIAAGCTMVVKPAQQTPLTMLALADLLAEVGVPAGVLNVISTTHTGDVMEPLIADPRLRKLTFTGSTPVGKQLVKQSADQLLRVSMELGGNAPFLVFADADLDAAVDGAMVAKMRNMGEACTAANRFLVHESVADEFATRFAEKMAAEKVGRGTEDGVTVGPLIDAKAVAWVTELLEDAGLIRKDGERYELTPRGIRKIGQRSLEEIFATLKKDAFGGHRSKARGRGGDPTDELKTYEFGDPFLLDLPGTVRNAVIRQGAKVPVKLTANDFDVYRTELVTQSATAILVDVSRSMLFRGCFLAAKKVTLALDSLIRSTFPKDDLYIVGFSAYATQLKPTDLPPSPGTSTCMARTCSTPSRRRAASFHARAGRTSRSS